MSRKQKPDKKANTGKFIIKILIFLVLICVVGVCGFLIIKHPEKAVSLKSKLQDLISTTVAKPEAKQSEIRRSPNKSALVVEAEHVYEIRDKMFYVDNVLKYAGSEKKDGKYVGIPMKGNAISVIDDVAYFKDEYGLMRYNMKTDVRQPLYYDLYDFVVVSSDYVYGFRNKEIHKINSQYEDEGSIGNYKDATLFEVVGNTAIYKTEAGLSGLNLESGEISEYQIEGDYVSHTIEGNTITITSTLNTLAIEVQ